MRPSSYAAAPRASDPRQAAATQPPSYASHDDPPPRRTWFRFAVLSVLGLLVLSIAGVAALLAFPPTSLVRDRLIQEVKTRTGRDVAITGATKFSVLPKLAVSMAGVTISPPPGMAGGPTLTMASLDAEVRLWPLILRDIVIDRLVLRQPVIDLRIDKTGRKSWDFAGGSEPWLPKPLVRYAQAGGKDLKQLPKDLQDFVKGAADGSDKPANRSASKSLDNLTLSDVRIEDGSLQYTDERSGAVEAVTGLNVTLTAKSLAAPIEALGRLTWAGETVDFNARAAPFRAVLEDKPAQIVATAKTAKADVAYDGLVILGQDVEIDGKLTANIPSIADAARWVGAVGLPPLPGGFNFGGQVKHGASVTTLSDATARLDKIAAAGTLSVDTKGVRPFIKGAIRFADLDFNALTALMDGANSAPVVKPRPTTPVVSFPESERIAPRSIEDLLRDGGNSPASKSKTQVRGFTQRDGWSDTEIDLSAAGLADADLKVAFNKLVYKELSAGTGQVTFGMKNKVARVTIDDIQMYEGRGRGLVTLDATTGTAVLGSNLLLDGVSTGSFLKDLAAFPWLSGKAKISLAVAGQGKTERQIIQTLNGKADISMGLGSLTGIDISEVLRGLAQGRLASIDHNPAKKTDFTDMGGSIAIANGIAVNKDFRVNSAAVRATGAGAIDLPQRQLDYTLKPKVTAGVDAGQGINLSGLEVPVKISGAWDKPTVTPDVSAVLKDPNAAIGAVKEFAKTPQGQEAQETLKGVINGDPAAQQKAKDFLNRFLKP
jgi:AsmA protein